MDKRPPRKPSAPLGTIVWSGGRVRLIHEQLPTTKDDLEAAIVRKFVSALHEHTGGDLQLLPRASPNGWPDFEGTLENRKIGIEVVEAIDPVHGRRRSRQDEYLRELLPRVANLEADLRGMCLMIDDGGQQPEWPPVRSKKGHRLLSELEGNLRAAVPELQRFGPRGGHLIWSRAPEPCTSVIVMRGLPLPGSPRTAVDLRFQSTFPMSTTFLASAVMGKIDKGYTAYPAGDLWLLVYSEHGVVTEPNAVALARRVIAHAAHPFAAVWAFFPLPEPDCGMLEELFGDHPDQ